MLKARKWTGGDEYADTLERLFICASFPWTTPLTWTARASRTRPPFAGCGSRWLLWLQVCALPFSWSLITGVPNVLSGILDYIARFPNSAEPVGDVAVDLADEADSADDAAAMGGEGEAGRGRCGSEGGRRVEPECGRPRACLVYNCTSVWWL